VSQGTRLFEILIVWFKIYWKNLDCFVVPDFCWNLLFLLLSAVLNSFLSKGPSKDRQNLMKRDGKPPKNFQYWLSSTLCLNIDSYKVNLHYWYLTLFSNSILSAMFPLWFGGMGFWFTIMEYQRYKLKLLFIIMSCHHVIRHRLNINI
jgi:hypothetical protein